MRSISTVCLAVVLFAAVPASAQEPGAVYGLITTVDGRGPVAGAVVRLVDDSDHVVRLQTDDRGRFARLGLRPGRYRAAIERDGFAAVDVIGVDIRSADRVRLYVEMTPFDEAPFKRQTVRYRRPLINTENATISTRVM
jgi:hypothetical protein